MSRDVDSMQGVFMVFLYWLVAGMGLHVGWGLIGLIIDMLQRSLTR